MRQQEVEAAAQRGRAHLHAHAHAHAGRGRPRLCRLGLGTPGSCTPGSCTASTSTTGSSSGSGCDCGVLRGDDLPVDGLEVEERVLVHDVDVREVGDDEEEHRGALGDDAVVLADLVDRGDRLLAVGHPHADRRRRAARGRQRVDQLLVVEDVGRGVVQQLQDARLDVGQLGLVVGDLGEQVVGALLEVRALALAERHEQLVLQPARRDREVDHRHLDKDFGQVVRVGQLGRDVEAELLRVGHVLVPETDQPLTALLRDLARKHRLDRGLQLLRHVLQQHGLPVTNRVLKRVLPRACAKHAGGPRKKGRERGSRKRA